MSLNKHHLFKANEVFMRGLRVRAVEIDGVKDLVPISGARVAYSEAIVALCNAVLEDLAKETERMKRGPRQRNGEDETMKVKCQAIVEPAKGEVPAKLCGAEWPSITQLRKSRKQGDRGVCPSCGAALRKAWFRR